MGVTVLNKQRCYSILNLIESILHLIEKSKLYTYIICPNYIAITKISFTIELSIWKNEFKKKSAADWCVNDETNCL